MKISLILRKFHAEEKEFVTSDDIKEKCRALKLNYDSVVKYLLYRNYLVRIFRGIFYVKTLEEIKLGKTRYNHLELVSKGMDLKHVKNWYFGLYTALKLNNLTHEHFALDYVVNDRIFRSNPVSIAGYRFRFLKLSPKLLSFGVIEKKRGSIALRHSDAEKTVLDFVYVWRYNSVPRSKIVLDISEWLENTSKAKMNVYKRMYPKTVANIIDSVVK